MIFDFKTTIVDFLVYIESLFETHLLPTVLWLLCAHQELEGDEGDEDE